MAKKSAIEKNKSRLKKVEKFKNKRKELKKLIMDKKTNQEEQLWVYFLKDKKLELSFKDFILFKIEEI